MRIPVTNNRECLVQVQVPTPDPSNNKMVQTELVVLKPGVTMVEAVLWEKAKENRLIRHMLSSNIEPSAAPEANPERVGQKFLIEGAPLPDDAPLKALRPAAAQALIMETFDPALLRSWLEEESRAEVRRNIEKQLNVVTEKKETKASGKRDV